MFRKVNSMLELFEKELSGERFIPTATRSSNSIDWYNLQLDLRLTLGIVPSSVSNFSMFEMRTFDL